MTQGKVIDVGVSAFTGFNTAVKLKKIKSQINEETNSFLVNFDTFKVRIVRFVLFIITPYPPSHFLAQAESGFTLAFHTASPLLSAQKSVFKHVWLQAPDSNLKNMYTVSQVAIHNSYLSDFTNQ